MSSFVTRDISELTVPGRVTLPLPSDCDDLAVPGVLGGDRRRRVMLSDSDIVGLFLCDGLFNVVGRTAVAGNRGVKSPLLELLN